MNPVTGLVITLILLLINAFFVAGEFATTSTRRSQIEPLFEQKRRGSTQAMFALEHVSLMLAICQMGITIASTSLGFVAEPAIAHLVHGPLAALGVTPAAAHVVGFIGALLIVLFLHVVFGEMVPKNISIAMPHKALLFLAPPLVAIGHIVHPIIVGMDSSANWFLRIFGVEPKSEISAVFTAEEVESIVELSQREGTLEDDLGLLTGTLEFSRERVEKVMIPLDRLTVLPSHCTPAQVEKEVAQKGYSRYPLADDNERIVGYIHLKDILYAQDEEREKPIEAWRIRAMEVVNTNDEVEDALRTMQRSGTHCARVVNTVNEETETLGVLFLEDIIEELVGEVRDSLQRENGQ